MRFNPHPPLLAGDSQRLRPQDRYNESFNPHPPLLAGDSCGLCSGSDGSAVSIHTRHYWRVIPGAGLLEAADRGCFNPHPPLLAGDSSAGAANAPIWHVSIHTRHYWRVIRLWLCRAAHQATASIHTRHYWRVIRSLSFSYNPRCRFQSTPAITGG